ncbi:MAG: winged helix-turn-helix domain-containing protein [Planctomycetes bacterium]|nr:winged helix-turn-helix domain-containing protein [Planctomycetota bacterium]
MSSTKSKSPAKKPASAVRSAKAAIDAAAKARKAAANEIQARIARLDAEITGTDTDGPHAATPATPATAAETAKDANGANVPAKGGKRATTAKPPKPAKEPKAAKVKAPKPPKAKRVSCLDAAAMVIAESKVPMRATEMIAAMQAKHLWSSPEGKTPEATLYAAIIREIAAKGNAARFKKHDRGVFVAGKGA